MHWTLADNWELQKHYHPESQFGLFHIPKDERAKGNVHRELTEGALAYQQVIDESRALSPTGTPTQAAVDNASEKFGEMASDGMQVKPPSRTHGRFWEGSTTQSPGGDITLYLGYVKASQKVTGMLFWHSLQEWRKVDLLVDAQGPFLRESWFDDVAETARSRDIRADRRRRSRGRVSGAGTAATRRGAPTSSTSASSKARTWGSTSPSQIRGRTTRRRRSARRASASRNRRARCGRN
jgi:hypothetical protein